MTLHAGPFAVWSAIYLVYVGSALASAIRRGRKAGRRHNWRRLTVLALLLIAPGECFILATASNGGSPVRALLVVIALVLAACVALLVWKSRRARDLSANGTDQVEAVGR